MRRLLILTAVALVARGLYVAVRDACAESPDPREDDAILGGDAFDADLDEADDVDDDDEPRTPNRSHGYVPALPTT